MSWKLASAPTGPVGVPGEVARLADGRSLTAVWKNQLGGVTWAADDIHIKWNPSVTGIDLTAEVERMTWLAPHVPCPEVLDHGASDDGQWLVTRTIDGQSAVTCTEDQTFAAVEAIAVGLRTLHDATPLAECPFTWSTEDRRMRALDRIERGDVDPARLHPQHHHLSPAAIAAQLSELPDPDLVVCHGDACAPNTLINDGQFAALVDLGSLGVGHRWADIAVAAWSLDWNFGPGHIDRFLDAYGVDRDDDLLVWHQLLWDLG